MATTSPNCRRLWMGISLLLVAGLALTGCPADSDGDGIPDKAEGLVDLDNDGLPNYLDSDSDGDFIPDVEEGLADTDEDGIADYIDPADSDRDGIPNNIEGADDLDDDSVPNYLDVDSDGDYILDAIEGTGDTDEDGIPDFLDVADSDGDGIPNDVEGTRDIDHDGYPAYLDLDSDGDTMPDAEEGLTDSDGDGIPDYLDPLDADEDGILDIVEGTGDADGDGTPNYLDPDSDGDGVGDRIEGAGDADHDGTPNYLDDDSDDDGLLDSVEGGDDPDLDDLPNCLDLDSDGDGIDDEIEGAIDVDEDGDPNYLDDDSDGDGILDLTEGVADPDADTLPNFLDTDSDGDGVSDEEEGEGDTDADGIPNYLDNDDTQSGEQTLEHGGLVRTYELHVPEQYDGTTDYPLFIVLHGMGQTGNDIALLSEFDALADAEDFFVAYPNAYEKNWNDGRAVTGIAAYDLDVDDVGFIDALVTRLATLFRVDEQRVYAVGMSNGAMMVFRLACEIPETFAAVAAVAGAMPVNLEETCTPSAALPFMLMNGTADPLVPWEGGIVGSETEPLGEVLSADDSIALLVDLNECPETPSISQEPDVTPLDFAVAYREEHAPGRDDSEVILYRIEGGGHTWPGGPLYQLLWLTGAVCLDFDATETIWEFCLAHTRE